MMDAIQFWLAKQIVDVGLFLIALVLIGLIALGLTIMGRNNG